MFRKQPLPFLHPAQPPYTPRSTHARTHTHIPFEFHVWGQFQIFEHVKVLFFSIITLSCCVKSALFANFCLGRAPIFELLGYALPMLFWYTNEMRMDCGWMLWYLNPASQVKAHGQNSRSVATLCKLLLLYYCISCYYTVFGAVSRLFPFLVLFYSQKSSHSC